MGGVGEEMAFTVRPVHKKAPDGKAGKHYLEGTGGPGGGTGSVKEGPAALRGECPLH